MDERDRTIEELRRANRRLSGALRIVLGTLVSQDVSTMISRVLEELAETMDADGTLLYLAEPDGFHLRGSSTSLEGAPIPSYMAFGRAIESHVSRAGRALRFSVASPRADELRQGALADREVTSLDSGEIYRFPVDLLPPFSSFVAVPVWFGGHVISIIEVGWRVAHAVRDDDIELLDSVASYLSAQFMGVFSAMRARHSAELERLGAEMRERLSEVAVGEGNGVVENLPSFWAHIAEKLHARAIAVEPDADLGAEAAEPRVVALEELPQAAALADGASGVLVDCGNVIGARRACIIARAAGAEPIDALEQAFLLRFAQDARDAALGEDERETTQRIAQTLQMGIRSELQEVPGITAKGVYTSATASALVGGDFYDLVRLPGHRACVIMGDVSGKGIEAASVSAAVRTALAAYAWEGLTPARMVRSLNDYLLGFARLETFATIFVGLIDLERGELKYCSAGHPPAILVRSATGEAEMCDVQSGVVGAFSDIVYTDGAARLFEGDMLVLYTDGSTEARSPEGAFFGEEGVRDSVMRAAGAGADGLLDAILADLDVFTGNRLEDDVALVALRFDCIGA